MRLTLVTRHRKLVVVTGDHVEIEAADGGETYVSNTGADVQVAPEPELAEEDHAGFGFRA